MSFATAVCLPDWVTTPRPNLTLRTARNLKTSTLLYRPNRSVPSGVPLTLHSYLYRPLTTSNKQNRNYVLHLVSQLPSPCARFCGRAPILGAWHSLSTNPSWIIHNTFTSPPTGCWHRCLATLPSCATSHPCAHLHRAIVCVITIRANAGIPTTVARGYPRVMPAGASACDHCLTT